MRAPSPNWPKIGIYVLHCSVAGIGVFLASVLVLTILEKALQPFVADRFLTGPVYPIQVALGLTFGLLLNARTQSPSAIFAWVPAAVWLLIGVDGYMRAGGMSYVRGHLFGTECGECIEQFFVVSPFYASVAYSLGSWLSLKILG